MDVTPQLIEQIDFPEKFRGYDPDEVDDFLERCGATITELTNRLNETLARAGQAEADALAAREAAAQQTMSAGAGLSDEDEIEHATRTLVLAKRTADAAVAEARQEAARIVSEAKDRSDAAEREATEAAQRLLAEARSTHENAVRTAREDAEREFGIHKERHLEEIRAHEDTKRLLAADIGTLETRMGEYLDDLRRVHEAVRSVIDDPQVLRLRPALDLSVPHAADVVETTAQEAHAPRYGMLNDPPSPPPPPAPTFAASPQTPVESADTEVPPHEEGNSDPWGPGSWSAVTETAVASETVIYDGPRYGEASGLDPNARFTTRAAEHAGFQAPLDPTHDRYLRQLDEAVNGPDVELDRAMSNFFEGDEGENPHFGR